MEKKGFGAIKSGRSRIFIVEDHPVLRNVLVEMIERCKDLQTCGTAATAADAVSRIVRLNPDLVLLDISLPDRSGLAVLKEVGQVHDHVKFLVLSIHFDSSYAEEALRLGAAGFVHKQEAPTGLLPAIYSVLSGNTIPLSPKSGGCTVTQSHSQVSPIT